MPDPSAARDELIDQIREFVVDDPWLARLTLLLTLEHLDQEALEGIAANVRQLARKVEHYRAVRDTQLAAERRKPSRLS